MVKKISFLFFMTLMVTTLYGEIEIGLSYIPGTLMQSEETKQIASLQDEEMGFFSENIIGFHAGYSFWWLFYIGVDSMAVPPWWVNQTTEYTDSDGTYHEGIDGPGFLNFFNVGIRPVIGPIYLMATAGINNLYIHSQYSGDEDTNLGVNLKLGAGLKLDSLTIIVTGTAVYNNFEIMQSTVETLIENDDPNAQDRFIKSLIPSVGFILHLGGD